jgi:hypothetical protein
VDRSARRIPTAVNLSFLDRSHYFFFQVARHLSSQVLSGSRSRPTSTQKIWERRKSNPGPLGLQPGTVTTGPQKWSVLMPLTEDTLDQLELQESLRGK